MAERRDGLGAGMGRVIPARVGHFTHLGAGGIYGDDAVVPIVAKGLKLIAPGDDSAAACADVVPVIAGSSTSGFSGILPLYFVAERGNGFSLRDKRTTVRADRVAGIARLGAGRIHRADDLHIAVRARRLHRVNACAAQRIIPLRHRDRIPLRLRSAVKHIRQLRTAGEGIFADACDRLGNCHLLQRRTAKERIHRNIAHAR